jgi:hypothetical protein
MRIFPFWFDREPLVSVLTRVLAFSAKFDQLVPQFSVWSSRLSTPHLPSITGNERWISNWHTRVHIYTDLVFVLYWMLGCFLFIIIADILREVCYVSLKS